MKNIRIAALLGAITLFACQMTAPSPTPTLAPTRTPRPTATARPTATESAAFDPEELSRLVVVQGFTIGLPVIYGFENDGAVLIAGNEEGTLTFSFTGETDPENTSLADLIDVYLGALERRGFTFIKSEGREIEVGGYDGLLVDLEVSVQNVDLHGAAVAAEAEDDFVLFGLGLSQDEGGKSTWATEGRPVFEGMIATIAFTDAQAECPVSVDDTYGFTTENPIRVGGDFISGPSRERAYLDHLRGPNGEALSYERNGSLPGDGDVILDAYQVTGDGVDVELYIDMYGYQEPQAPVGFTCTGDFPLAAP